MRTGKKVNVSELVVGKRYFCGWASRLAVFEKIYTRKRAGKTETVAVFRDVCDAWIECPVDLVEKWVEEYKK